MASPISTLPLESLEQEARPPRARKRAPVFRLCLCLAWFLAFRAIGNVSLAWGTRHVAEHLSANPLAYLRAMSNPFVALGILMLTGGLLTRLALFSLADLSFVVPVTAVGYVIAVFLGKVLLHETVSPERWLGVVMIVSAVVLVGSTSRNTTGEDVSEKPSVQ